MQGDGLAQRFGEHGGHIVASPHRAEEPADGLMQKFITHSGDRVDVPPSVRCALHDVFRFRPEAEHGVFDGFAAGVARIFPLSGHGPYFAGQRSPGAAAEAVEFGFEAIHVPAEMHDELPMFAIVFSVPSVVALILWGKFNGTR